MTTNAGSCFLCGIGFGVVAGLMFAPRSGERTRAEIRRRARDTRGYIEKQTSELSEQISDTFDRTKRAVNETANGIGQAFEAGRQVLTR
jgi:gas vesicle protein